MQIVKVKKSRVAFAGLLYTARDRRMKIEGEAMVFTSSQHLHALKLQHLW